MFLPCSVSAKTLSRLSNTLTTQDCVLLTFPVTPTPLTTENCSGNICPLDNCQKALCNSADTKLILTKLLRIGLWQQLYHVTTVTTTSVLERFVLAKFVVLLKVIYISVYTVYFLFYLIRT